MSHVVIAGAGLGGLRAAERLRAAGHPGPVTVLGAESYPPYNRPPLSKELLADRSDLTVAEALQKVAFRRRKSVADVDFRLEHPVTSADLATGTLTLADGADVNFDGLVVATGLRSRRLVSGAHVLRTLDDCQDLRAAFRPGTRVAIVGGGFIGCEVAGTARSLGCAVTVIEADPAPMARVLGLDLATAVQRCHERAGNRFVTGTTVAAVADGTLELSDGEQVTADVIVEATGSLPNIEWLAGNGMDLSDGVLCDNTLAVAGAALPVAGPSQAWRGRVVAVGDVARFPNPLFDAVPRRVEHWSMPTDTARQAAVTLHAALTGQDADAEPFAPLPSFWSDQLDLRMESYGSPSLGEDARVAEGDLGDLAAGLIVTYHRDGRHVGTVAVNIPVSRHRELREELLKELRDQEAG